MVSLVTKYKPYFYCLGLTVFCLWYSAESWAQTIDAKTQIFVKPKKCVSLNRGQTCYQKFTVRWLNKSGKNMCLFRANSQKPLMCHAISEWVTYTYPFASHQGERLELRDASGQLVSAIDLEVASVYGGRRQHRGWRLF